MLSATFALGLSARTFGAVGGVPSTISLPFQWNQIGTTRGPRSRPTYASRAGEVDRNSSCARGSLSNERLPCFVAISSSFNVYDAALNRVRLARLFNHLVRSKQFALRPRHPTTGAALVTTKSPRRRRPPPHDAAPGRPPGRGPDPPRLAWGGNAPERGGEGHPVIPQPARPGPPP